jgi:hypothetical protein
MAKPKQSLNDRNYTQARTGNYICPQGDGNELRQVSRLLWDFSGKCGGHK